MKLFTLVAVLATVFTLEAQGQCLNPTLTPGGPVSPGMEAALEFDPVEGATRYRIEAFDPLAGGWFLVGTTPQPLFQLPPFGFASDQALDIRILAENGAQTVTCIGEITVEFEADARLRSEFGRVVIPVAGSLVGAFQSQWRTMLSLTNNRTHETLTGSIIFHPAGSIASDQDPSIRYSLQPGEVEQWEDVVAAMGASGLGSLDIKPDEIVAGEDLALGGYVPSIQVRVINDAGDATYGTKVDDIFVRDLAPPQVRQFLNGQFPSGTGSRGLGSSIIVPSDYGQTRLNIGFRFFDFADLFWLQPLDPQSTPFVQLALRRDGEYIESVFRERPAGYMEQVPVEEIFTSQIMPGDVIVVRSISALTYWTITDNDTNDPSFFFDTYVGESKRIAYE